ncbi:hypothetical protein DJFAAGMI_01851 [Comamonas sp. PE63]|uniref:Uncharacterized protein n=1 Tax=Comamonas brasiliensis TaxID=1812482 RepID=A0ABS5LS10_9BURK|nr:YfbU family protein [Comamonas sp. PE63]MBS3019112.1 hypothetical protein [Comamonas sp. PE63]
MNLTPAEKLIIELLCDSLKGKDSVYDVEFLSKVISSNETWAISKRYQSLEDKSPEPAYVTEVYAILEAYRWVYDTTQELGPRVSEIRSIVQEKGQVHVQEKFDGFDGNNESDHLSAAHIIVDDLRLYEEQKGRVNNTHGPRRDAYVRVANAYMKLREEAPDGILPRTYESLLEVFREAAKLKLDIVLLDPRWAR